MAQALLQAHIDIDAPPADVWQLISDLSLMPQWSPQCRLMKAFGPLRPGTRTVNVNRRGFLFWPTTSRVTEVIPNASELPRQREQHGVDLRTRADRHRDPTRREPARRELTRQEDGVGSGVGSGTVS